MDVSGHSGAYRGEPASVSPRWWRRRWFKVVVALCLVALGGLGLSLEYVLHHAEPIIRKRIIETLSARFGAPVTLDRVEISLWKGIEVSGYGLRIPYPEGAGPRQPTLLEVRHFAFRTSLRGLLHPTTHVDTAVVEGMEVHIPPPDARASLFKERPDDAGIHPRIALVVDRLHCTDVRLILDSSKPDKDPLVFNISSLELLHVGRGQAMLYDAQLMNPKPRGSVHAKGHFGPWAGVPVEDREVARIAPDPGKTPLDGEYTLDHADLNTIAGIGGTLSSAGHFAGVLDRMVVDGAAEVPNFSLDLSNRPVPLHTRFHAIVDGTSGDTYLEPVHARLEQSDFVTRGKIVNRKGQGHDIDLTVDIPHGRMQDFLRLAMKTNPPLMSGTLAMTAKLHIPPGHERVPLKMEMEGSFHVQGVRFGNPKWQSRVDGLSARAQGKPEAVGAVDTGQKAETQSQMSAQFSIRRGVLSATDVRYAVPGATVLLNGVYSMDGKLFEFKGHVRTQATASQMVTGWKSLLLRPLDHFLEKNGAGVELPVEISGTQGDMHFGLATHGVDDTPGQMLADARGRQRNEAEGKRARQLMQQAADEDGQAARAPSLAEASKAHEAAVRDRAEAWRLLQAAKSGDFPQR